MQDRYAGDLGDFLKFGLLRWLAPPDSPWPRLGVIWYRTADEAHNADGKHIAYLTPGHRSAGRLRQLDPDLYERLTRIVSSGQRSTAALASAGVLGAQTRFFGDLLDLADLPASAREARQARRRSWTQRALAATSGCDLIFAEALDRSADQLRAAPPAQPPRPALVDHRAHSRGQPPAGQHHRSIRGRTPDPPRISDLRPFIAAVQRDPHQAPIRRTPSRRDP
jgi:hypothetical protein